MGLCIFACVCSRFVFASSLSFPACISHSCCIHEPRSLRPSSSLSLLSLGRRRLFLFSPPSSSNHPPAAKETSKLSAAGMAPCHEVTRQTCTVETSRCPVFTCTAGSLPIFRFTDPQHQRPPTPYTLIVCIELHGALVRLIGMKEVRSAHIHTRMHACIDEDG